jgi:ubiquinone/menaquinone biosynthesis C-methylase UbiE
MVYGIDVSNAAVSKSRKVNKELVANNRVKIKKASVSKLPFPDNTFDLVTAFETYYFWPDLYSDIKEVYRVLKSGGELMIVGEAYPGEKDKKRNKLVFKRDNAALETNFLGIKDFQNFLKNSSFKCIDVSTDIEKGWICACGKRPD